MEKEGNTQRDRMKEQGRAKDIFPLLVHSGNGCNVWQGETKVPGILFGSPTRVAADQTLGSSSVTFPVQY